MRLLALDTTMQACSAAVLVADNNSEARLYARFEPMNQGHAERLLPMVQEVLAEAGINMADVDRIAVTRGPGSFTGVRIGIATARGLALATGAGLIGENALRAIAADYVTEHPEQADTAVAVAIDARRGQVYFQLFAGLAPIDGGPLALTPAEAVQRLPDDARLAVIGSGGALLQDAAAAAGRPLPPLPAYRAGNPQPTAAALARLTASQPVSDTAVAPLYLRPPDAKPPQGYALERAHQEGQR